LAIWAGMADGLPIGHEDGRVDVDIDLNVVPV
jgi:hypothetical protein